MIFLCSYGDWREYQDVGKCRYNWRNDLNVENCRNDPGTPIIDIKNLLKRGIGM